MDRNENVAAHEPLHWGGKSNLKLLLLRMTLPRINIPKREKSSLVNFLQKDLQFPQNVNPPPVIMIVVDRRLNHLPERRENPNISLLFFICSLSSVFSLHTFLISCDWLFSNHWLFGSVWIVHVLIFTIATYLYTCTRWTLCSHIALTGIRIIVGTGSCTIWCVNS
jgi:hypothetical protein